MGGKHRDRAGRNVVDFIHEHRALGAQLVDHPLVMNDLVTHVDRRAEPLEREFDDIDRSDNPSAESSRLGEEDFQYHWRLLRRLERLHATPRVQLPPEPRVLPII